MNNYTLEIKDKQKRAEEQEKFVLRYEIKDKEIIVHLANAKKVKFPYTKEFEKMILECMEKEVFDYHELISNAKRKKKSINDMLWSLIMCGMVISFYAIFIFVISMSSNVTSLINILSLMLGVALASFVVRKVINNRYNDFEKNILFIQNEEKINVKLREKKSLNKVLDKKNQKNLVVKPDGEIGYTINSIDKMSLGKLKKVLEKIKEDENCERINSDLENKDVETKKIVKKINY